MRENEKTSNERGSTGSHSGGRASRPPQGPQDARSPSDETRFPWFAVAGVLLATAVALLAGPWRFTSPVPPPATLPAWVTETATVRHPKLKSEIEIAGFTYNCSDCHKLFESPAETTRSLTQHTNIVLNHGVNDRCFNCHHRTNRDAYVDDAGGQIPAHQPELLCGKCHGPVYRDWLNGAHGRTNGYWDASKGPQTRRKCTECHDPHQPAFAAMHPAPGPHTPRMGDQHFDEHHEERNPLRVFRQKHE